MFTPQKCTRSCEEAFQLASIVEASPVRLFDDFGVKILNHSFPDRSERAPQ